MVNPHGRPSPPPEEALDDRLTNRVNSIEKVDWKKAAELSDMTFSDWIRQTLNKAASRILGKKPKP